MILTWTSNDVAPELKKKVEQIEYFAPNFKKVLSKLNNIRL